MANWWEEEGIDVGYLEDAYPAPSYQWPSSIGTSQSDAGTARDIAASAGVWGDPNYAAYLNSLTMQQEVSGLASMLGLEEASPGALDIMQLGGLGMSELFGGGWGTAFLNDPIADEWFEGGNPWGSFPDFGLGALGPTLAKALADAGFIAGDFINQEVREDFFSGGLQGGGGGYGGYAPPYPGMPESSGDPKWIFADPDYKTEGAPDWFRGLTVEDPEDLEREDVALTMSGLGLSPFMSAGDQEATLEGLAQWWHPRGEGGMQDPWDIYTFDDAGGGNMPARPMMEQSLNQFGIGQTAPGGLAESGFLYGDQFDKMRNQLQNMRDAIYQGSPGGYEGAPVMSALDEGIGKMMSANLGTRAGRAEAQASIDPWLASFTGETAAYKPLAERIVNPFFANVPGGLFGGPQRNKYVFG
jgi:hypothetical protein